MTKPPASVTQKSKCKQVSFAPAAGDEGGEGDLSEVGVGLFPLPFPKLLHIHPDTPDKSRRTQKRETEGPRARATGPRAHS